MHRYKPINIYNYNFLETGFWVSVSLSLLLKSRLKSRANRRVQTGVLRLVQRRQSPRYRVSMEENETEIIHSVVGFKSAVWKDFGFYKRDGELDKTTAICELCRAAIRYTGSTTNLSTHLKRRHNMPQSPATSASSAPATPSREPRIPQFFH